MLCLLLFVASANGLLLATDVAARGLDIPGVQHVIHYQVPRTTEVCAYYIVHLQTVRCTLCLENLVNFEMA